MVPAALTLAVSVVMAAAAPAAAASPASIMIGDMAFGAPPASVRVGTVVEWVNRDIFQHTATARDGSFDLVIPPGGRASVILKTAGAVRVYCRYHPGMTVVLRVTK